MGATNYYAVLGIGRDADDEAVKQAFRERAKECHPDLNPDAATAEQFKLVNTAYEALKDASRREAYNEWLAFAETRERSRVRQWARLAALIAVLVTAPVVLFLLVSGGAQLAAPEGPTQPAKADKAVRRQAESVPTAPASRKAANTARVEPVRVEKAPAKETPEKQDVAASPGAASGDDPAATAPRDAVVENDAAKATARAQSRAEPVGPAENTGPVREAPRTAASGKPRVDKPQGRDERQPMNSAARTTQPEPTPRREKTPAKTDPAAVGSLPQDRHAALSREELRPDQAPAAEPPIEPGRGQGGLSQFADCDGCPVMAVLPSEARAGTAARRATPRKRRRTVAISRSEITIAEWNVCVADGACARYSSAGGTDPHRPVRGIRPREADAFIKWLSRKTGHPYRLVSAGEAERRQRAAFDSGKRKCTGWEWLEDNPRSCTRGGVRSAAKAKPPEALDGLRVMRPLRPIAE